MNVSMFDKKVFLERMLGDWELCVEIMDDFMSDLPEQLRIARAAAASNEQEVLERQAHAIKGAASNVAAETLRATAYEAEKLARDGRLEEAKKKILELEDIFEKTKFEMQAHLGPAR